MRRGHSLRPFISDWLMFKIVERDWLMNLCDTNKGRRPLQAPNRLIAEFNMGCYGYGDSASQRVLIGAHVKFSD